MRRADRLKDYRNRENIYYHALETQTWGDICQGEDRRRVRRCSTFRGPSWRLRGAPQRGQSNQREVPRPHGANTPGRLREGVRNFLARDAPRLKKEILDTTKTSHRKAQRRWKYNGPQMLQNIRARRFRQRSYPSQQCLICTTEANTGTTKRGPPLNPQVCLQP